MLYNRIAMILVVGLLCSTGLRAQSLGCGEVLKYGVWETYQTKDRTSISDDMKRWACSAASSSSGGVLKYDKASLDFSSSGSSSACSSNESSYAFSRDFEQSFRKAAPEIVAAWERCMAADGANASVLYRSDPRFFTIVLTKRPRSENATLISQQSVACGNRTLGVPFRVETRDTVSCSKSPGETAYIDVKWGGGFPGQSLVIPGGQTSALKGPLTTAEIKRLLVGKYQVMIGSSGGCEGPANYRPQKLARIEHVGDELRAINECDRPSALTVQSPFEVTFYGASADLAISGDVAKIIGPTRNIWLKVE